MKRFSQRNPLVTLNEINITPLLDLAFVLLIIFVITTPLLEQGLDLQLPVGGAPAKKLEKNDIKTVEVSSTGVYMLGRQRMTLDQIEKQLVADFKTNPRIVINLRADENGPYKYVVAIIDRCERNGIKAVSLRTQSSK